MLINLWTLVKFRTAEWSVSPPVDGFRDRRTAPRYLLYSRKAIRSGKLSFTGQRQGERAKFERIAPRMFPQIRRLSSC